MLLSAAAAELKMNLRLDCSNQDFAEPEDPYLRAMCASSLTFAGEMENDLMSDQMNRRSGDGNYIRFGRKGQQVPALGYLIGFGQRDKKDGHYMRFGRSVDSKQQQKDTRDDDKRFMRFGRTYNQNVGADDQMRQKKYMRFGRAGQPQIEKSKENAKRYMRFGKRMQENALEDEPKLEVDFSGGSLVDMPGTMGEEGNDALIKRK